MTELSRIQKDAIMKEIGMDVLHKQRKAIRLSLLNQKKICRL